MTIIRIIWSLIRCIVLFNENQKIKLELLKKLDDDINKAIEELKAIER